MIIFQINLFFKFYQLVRWSTLVRAIFKYDVS